MDTIVYVDGFNVYYGALKRTPHKWLDCELQPSAPGGGGCGVSVTEPRFRQARETGSQADELVAGQTKKPTPRGGHQPDRPCDRGDLMLNISADGTQSARDYIRERAGPLAPVTFVRSSGLFALPLDY